MANDAPLTYGCEVTPRLLKERAAGPVLVALFLLALFLAAVPAAAQAASVTMRIEGPFGSVLDRTSVTLPSTPVAPAGAPDGQTCAPNTVAGAVHAASNGDWAGAWTDGTGWSIERIRGVTAAPATERVWAVMLNGTYLNESPCTTAVADGYRLVLFPLCKTSTSQCFSQGPLEIHTTDTVGPGTPLVVSVRETTISFDSFGNGTSVTGPSVNTSLFGPDGNNVTDPYYGQGALLLTKQGDNVIGAGKTPFVPDRTHVCVTDGHDGYCGTTATAPNPFDPQPFCQTSGADGFCGTPDHLAPLAHVLDPAQGTAFPKAGGPLNLTGTADFDPSGIPTINFRLMRTGTATKIKFKKRKVTVKKRVRGKVVKRRVTKRVKVRVRVKACYGLNAKAGVWRRLTACDSSKAPVFTTEGGDSWTYELPVALPSGSFTLDAQAQDGAGNIDVPEPGRNRVTFKIA
jgi:hypothetical protein